MSAPRVAAFLSSGQVLAGYLVHRGFRTLVLLLEGDGARVEIRRSAVIALATEPEPKKGNT